MMDIKSEKRMYKGAPTVISQTVNSRIFQASLIAVTFVSIAITGIIFKQQFIRILPLFISLFIMLFQANANRYAYVAGGLNCLLYTYVYIQLGLYANAASAIFFSFPIQILTFINWKKHAYKDSVIFKKMTHKTRIYLSIFVFVVWVIIFAILKILNSDYAFLDNTVSLFGIVVSVLTMLAYIEYSYLWIISIFLSVLLNIQLAINNPAQITYVIYSVYSLVCTVIAFINVIKLYKTQQTEKQ